MFGFQGNPGVNDALQVEIVDGTNQPIAPADLKGRFVNILSNPTRGWLPHTTTLFIELEKKEPKPIDSSFDSLNPIATAAQATGQRSSCDVKLNSLSSSGDHNIWLH